jgi:hypothetical protein
MRFIGFLFSEIAAMLGILWPIVFEEIIAPAIFLMVVFSPIILAMIIADFLW